MKSFIPWVGGKSKLLWLIHKLSPSRYSRFIDVFGGSGTVTLSRPIQQGCMEVYNDFNGDLTNLFCCVKNRTMALLLELGFLPLNTRDDFNVLYKFFSREEFTDDYLDEEMELTQRYLEPPDAKTIRRMMLERAPRGDVRRAADYFKLILAEVVIENKDCVDLIRQYDREDAFFYCDPPYYDAEDCYAVGFPKEDHQRLHDALLECQGYVMVSYNYCPFIVDLYKEFYIFYTTRPNSMSQKAGSEYEEIVITNYDPRLYNSARHWQLSIFNLSAAEEDDGRYTLIHEPKTKSDKTEE